jgi:calcineurin-like phosphoesterase family protein
LQNETLRHKLGGRTESTMEAESSRIITTARTVREVLDRPEAVEGVEKATGDSVKAAATLAFLARVKASIDKAQAKMGDNVMTMPSAEDDVAREASVLLSMLAEGESGSVTTTPLPQGGLEAKFDTRDWSGWATVAVQKLLHLTPHPILRPTVQIRPFPNRARIAVLGDWGTNLYGAPKCAEQIKSDPGNFTMLLHLGDVYYSGTHNEVKNRFLTVWPKRNDPGLIQRAINSNHEMYSGGDAYFNDTLPTLGQDASYFAFANKYWLLVGLDTAYVDHDMDEQQVDWLKSILDHPSAKDKKVVFFSHQQLFSPLESQGWKLDEDAKLGLILQNGRVNAWYWGHEHRCCIYEKHPDYGLFARCIGHSGMPETREKVNNWAVDQTVNTPQDPVMWRRFPAAQKSKSNRKMRIPSGIVLDGRNRYITAEEEKFAPHGYATLDFNGPDLVERVFTPDGAEIHQMKVA